MKVGRLGGEYVPPARLRSVKTQRPSGEKKTNGPPTRHHARPEKGGKKAGKKSLKEKNEKTVFGYQGECPENDTPATQDGAADQS